MFHQRYQCCYDTLNSPYFTQIMGNSRYFTIFSLFAAMFQASLNVDPFGMNFSFISFPRSMCEYIRKLCHFDIADASRYTFKELWDRAANLKA
ncbi:hypothetical protein BpHYR1_003522 [Brachionus plicatilis]|uniref:Uncharacterized protein n=1 Tax=Brachionus plicatilis TaxID=10195 RepID=A0A3M7RV88_BRAPC|nr:hypothetical protein BpHYR1_003522 [Brachionus plicatilis]